MSLTYIERIELLSIHPDAATRRDVRIMTADLMEKNRVLELIAEYGGRTSETSDGPLNHNGSWCAEQAKQAMKGKHESENKSNRVS